MRFESLLRSILLLLLAGGIGWDGDSLVGGVRGGAGYQAADGGSGFPPPDKP